MYHRFQCFFPLLKRNFSVVFLAFFWIFGLFFGAFTGQALDADAFHVLSRTITGRPSLLGLFSVVAIPFSLTVFSLFIGKRFILFLICFFRAFVYGVFVQGIVMIYGSGGWLLTLLVMFTATCMIPLDCWIWIRYLSDNRNIACRHILAYTSAALFIILIDYFVVSVFFHHIFIS